MTGEPIVEVSELTTRFGDHVVHDGVSLSVCRGEIFAIVGASGSGKSVMMREMALLQEPTSGTIRLFGEDVHAMDERRLRSIRRNMGVLFQSGALFSDLTVAENVMVPLREYTRLDERLMREVAALKISLSGLAPKAGALYPSQLSGGMVKRAALARAMALDPELLFLDEPGSGLDPVSTNALDALVRQLRNSQGLTIIMVTHDIQSLRNVADRVAFIGEGQLLAVASVDELSTSDLKAVREFFRRGAPLE